MRKINQLIALAILGIFALTSCGGAKSKGISQANQVAAKPTVTAPAPAVIINLTGKVIDYTNKAPVPGAKLITFDKQEVTASDKGEFTLQVPQDKGFTFRVKAQGYQETLAGGRIKAATSGVEIKIAKLNSGIFPVTLNIGDKGAKLFKGPTVPKVINITQGKLYQIAFPVDEIYKFTGLTNPIALSYFDAFETHTWQYIIVNADGSIKSGIKWLEPPHGYFLLGTSNSLLEFECLYTGYANYTAPVMGAYGGAAQQWNLIGCPYREPMPLSYCYITSGARNFKYNLEKNANGIRIYNPVTVRSKTENSRYNLEEAYENNLTGPPIFYHYNGDTSSWEEVSYPNGALEPNEGYYYLGLTDCLIDLINVPYDADAENLLQELATKFKQNDIEAVFSHVWEDVESRERAYLAGYTSEQFYALGEGLGNAVLVKDYEGRERWYDFKFSIDGVNHFRRIKMEKDNLNNWKIFEF